MKRTGTLLSPATHSTLSVSGSKVVLVVVLGFVRVVTSMFAQLRRSKRTIALCHLPVDSFALQTVTGPTDAISVNQQCVLSSTCQHDNPIAKST